MLRLPLGLIETLIEDIDIERSYKEKPHIVDINIMDCKYEERLTE